PGCPTASGMTEAPKVPRMQIATGSTIIPCLRYRDAPAAIEWLCRAFGFERHAVYADGDTVHHAQLSFGSGMVMLGSAGTDSEWRRQLAQPAEPGLRAPQSPAVTGDDAPPPAA